MTHPDVQPGDAITVGVPPYQKTAVVTVAYSDDVWQDRIEAVYFDDRQRATAEDFRWNGRYWDYVSDGGMNADNHDRLRPFTAQLRRLHTPRRF